MHHQSRNIEITNLYEREESQLNVLHRDEEDARLEATYLSTYRDVRCSCCDQLIPSCRGEAFPLTLNSFPDLNSFDPSTQQSMFNRRVFSVLGGEVRSDSFPVSHSISNNNNRTVTPDPESQTPPGSSTKFTWHPALEELFQEALDAIGWDKATAKRVMSFMLNHGAEGMGLTRSRVASHLQKFRVRWRNYSDKT
eukprot:TRINITY_DN9209_c0_g1_i1.p1 TRINITY_DN9209_c0_g1~~TRINITY_DN9209_c0_g1_i1.p1  ORF type:complete len:195 (+),score=42.60 TRINITY_DN9209_c0_g1_i1:194-778(+)